MLRKNLAGLMICLLVGSAEASDRAATNCEIFVDRVMTTLGSHDANTLYLYVKTANVFLDGAITEVGFYNQAVTTSYRDVERYPWRATPFSRFLESDNYFEIGLPMSSDFASTEYQGAIYLRTTKGTFYWAKDSEGRDFVFGAPLVKLLNEKRARVGAPSMSPDPKAAYPTNEPTLDFLNGPHCI